MGKESACSAGDAGSIPGSGRLPWRRAGQPTPVFLPGESHGRRSLAGYSHGVSKESDTTEEAEHTGCVKEIFVHLSLQHTCSSSNLHSYGHKSWEYSEKGADRPIPSGTDILSCWVGMFLDYNSS